MAGTLWEGLLLIVRVFLGLCLAAYAFYALLSVWAARQWHRARRPLVPDWTPPVTILKPVYGVDAHAYNNFASFCCLDYPSDHVQIVFGALDPADPALDVARQLQKDYPQYDIAIAAPPAVSPPQGHNLKVCNLLAMLPAAKHDLLVLCDSDMRVLPHYLREVTAPFKEGRRERGKEGKSGGSSYSFPPSLFPLSLSNVGLVTCPYRGFLPESLPARLEALGIGADFIPSTLVSRALEGVGFAFGSTIALRKQTLAQIGGFEAILDELADDFRLGEGVRKAGYEVVLSNYVVDDVLGRERFGPMWARRLRWARTVRACRPAGYAGAFVTHGIALGLLFWLAMGLNRFGFLALASVLALRVGVSLWIASAYTQDENIRFCWPLLPLSDLLNTALYAASFCGRHIVWRGQRFRLKAGGKIERIGV